MPSQQRLFRAQALQQYAQSREKGILPRLVAPPVFLCGWILLGVLLLTTLLAWQAQVPLFAVASGMLVHQPPTSQQAAARWEALLFVPAPSVPDLHGGESITVQVVLTGTLFPGTITSVTPNALTPEEARQRYALSGDQALIITQPSVVVSMALEPPLPADTLAGSTIRAQVPVGSVSLLALLPHLLSGLLGG